MTSMMHNDDSPHVPQTADLLHVRAWELTVETSERRVEWREDGDLGVVVKVASESTGVDLPLIASEGYVLVALGVDDDDADHILTQPRGIGLTNVDVIEKAIEALRVAARGIERTQLTTEIASCFAALGEDGQARLAQYAEELLAEQAADALAS